MASQIAASGTVSTSSTSGRQIASVRVPGRSTAIPSAMVATGELVAARPERNEAANAAAPSAWTPTTRTPGGRDLDRRRAGWHVDHRGDAEVGGGEGDALGVVAGARRHDAAPAHGGGQPGHVHERPAQLEGAGPLQQLALEVDLPASLRRRAGEHRGGDGDAAELLGRPPDVLDAHCDGGGDRRDGRSAGRAGQGGWRHGMLLQRKTPRARGTEGWRAGWREVS